MELTEDTVELVGGWSSPKPPKFSIICVQASNALY